MRLALEFICSNAHHWEVWWCADGLRWKLLELNPEWEGARSEAQAEGLDEYDQQRAEVALMLEDLDEVARRST